MIVALALAAAAPVSAIEAERAFAADAHRIGQWAAFRKWSTPDATMFVPEPVNAHQFLEGKAEPPVEIFWWPGRSHVSCDGGHAVNTGPWVREGGKAVGYFTTVWVRQPDGSWKWIYDGGDSLETPRAQGGDIAPVVASCDPKPAPFAVTIPPAHSKNGGGRSADGTLVWHWAVQPGGERRFKAHQWTNDGWKTVVDDQVSAKR